MTYCERSSRRRIEFVRYSFSPWLRRIELAISERPPICAFERQFVKFELDGLLRADAKTRAEVYTARARSAHRAG